ncbi:MAG: F0F1 ATP synthase subunit delta [Prevotellaceae bacterium]|nr:F0F1 ATP synthase subunit delta [Prevotellaceae bacterium]
MDSGTISKRYAKAIYRFAAEKGEETPLFEEMKTVAKQFSAFPALKKALENPTVSPKEKEALLLAAAGKNAGETCKNALRVVVENGRASSMHSIAMMYEKVYRDEKNMVQVNLTTVIPADKETEKSLISLILKEKSGTVDFLTKTDNEIIGGFIVEIDDLRLDASVKNQLNQMRLELVK